MSTTQPTVVIVPGAWQLAVGFNDLVEQLKAAGVPAEAVSLPSIGGTETPLKGFSDDVAAVRQTVIRLAEEAKEVVLLCHSYGGVVGSSAVEGLDVASRQKAGGKGGVVLTVYLAAFMIPKGRSLLDMLGGAPLPWMKVEGDRVTCEPTMMQQIALNDVPEEKIPEFASQMSHTAASVFATPATYEPWADGLSCAYIHCTDDNALPYPVQQQMVAQLGPNPTAFTLKAGHCPYLSIPEELAKTVVQTIQVARS